MKQADEIFHLKGTILPDDKTRDVFIVDRHLTFQPQSAARTVFTGGYLVPGLVDAHTHLALASPAPDTASPHDRVRASARAQLHAGVLALREPGSPDHASIGLGPDEGLPRVYTAGQFLAPEGGYFPGLARLVSQSELPQAAVAEYKASGAWAKVIGDFFDEAGNLVPNWRPETLAETARQVHAAGGRIAIHAILADVIHAAIAAGFDSIEHGNMLSTDHIQLMVKRQTVLVPTLMIKPGILEIIANSPAKTRDMLQTALKAQPEMVRRAAAAGVTVLAGTDAGMGPHGEIAVEVERLLAAGLPPDVALDAASWTARKFIGLPGIEEGAPADLVGYPDDPRRSAEILRHPTLMILDGKTVKSPSVK